MYQRIGFYLLFVVVGFTPLPTLAEKVGANVPFTTLEAEAKANTTDGDVVVLSLPTAPEDNSPQLEASGRAFVQLDAEGESLTFNDVPAADAMVLRHCIPDAAAGGGIEATLSVYVNGAFRQSITLTSKYNWLYGEPGKNGQSNDPAAGEPHVYWDDTRFLIQGGLKRGDTLTFKKDAADVAAFYRIDLVDLEQVPPPLEPPPGGVYLSITDYGATGDDDRDDTDAIVRCIADAKAQGKPVWMPPGVYYQSSKFMLDGVVVHGAGMWHTELIGNTPGHNFAGELGFVLAGDGATVTDLFITSDIYTCRPDPKGGRPFTAVFGETVNYRVENVWMTRVHNAFWMSGANRGLIRGCRSYLSYADAININRGSSDCVIEHNYIRGAGDDGVVFLAQEKFGDQWDPMSVRNTIRHNTVVANWWGHNCAIGGGEGHVVEDNYLADNAHSGCLAINLPDSFPKYPLSDTVIRRNTIVRGGSNYAGQRRGAVWINPSYNTVTATVFLENRVIDALYSAFDIRGGKAQQIRFERNIIDHPRQHGFFIRRDAVGTGTFSGNVVRDLNPGFKEVADESNSDYTMTLKD